MSESHAVAYKALRGRVREVVEGSDPAALDAIVPATPEWRARDVLAHLVGVTDDVVNGRMDGIATDGVTHVKQISRQKADALQDALVCGVLIHQNKAVRIFHQDIQLAEYADDLELLLSRSCFSLQRL